MKYPSGTKTIAVLFALFLTGATQAENFGEGKRGKARESVEVSDHLIFGTTTTVNGATILVRDKRNRVINATITSRALEPDTAYSIWWAVFNYPRFCIEPYRCALADLGPQGDPRVKPSVFWAGGFLSDIYGFANTAIRLVPGRTKRELFAGGDFGLQNFGGAEIHVVLRSHGTAGMAGPVAQQIGTASEACPPEMCSNVFASIHIPNQ